MQIRGISTVAILTFVSRVLGLARDAGMAVLFGAGPLLDAFSVAFRLPNLARRLFGEGALTAAFLPVFVKVDAVDSVAARRLAWRTTLVLSAVLAAAVLIVESVSLLLLSSVSGEPAVLVELIAWLFPYVLFICVAAQLSAVLHGRNHFFWPAAMPALLNCVWLAALVVAPKLFDEPMQQMRLVAASVLVAGLLQLVLMERVTTWVGAGWSGVDVLQKSDQTRSAMRDVWRTMLPTIFGLTVTQLNVVVDSTIAWAVSPSSGIDSAYHLVEEGTATALYLGQRLFQFPLGVFGVALGTVLFPVFTRHAQAGDQDALSRDLTAGLRLCVCIGVPASLGLILLAEPIPRVMFEYGEFDARDVLLTSKMIACYGLGVWSTIGLLIVSRAFYAIGDTRTPLTTGLWAVVVNIALNVVLVFSAGGPGLALATTLSGMFQLAHTTYLADRMVAKIGWEALRSTTVKTAIASIAMAVAVEVTLRLTADWHRVLVLVVPLIAGVLAFAVVAYLTKLEEINWLIRRDREFTESA